MLLEQSVASSTGEKLGNPQSTSSSKEGTQLCYRKVDMGWGGRWEEELGEYGFTVALMLCTAHAPFVKSRKRPTGKQQHSYHQRLIFLIFIYSFIWREKQSACSAWQQHGLASLQPSRL